MQPPGRVDDVIQTTKFWINCVEMNDGWWYSATIIFELTVLTKSLYQHNSRTKQETTTAWCVGANKLVPTILFLSCSQLMTQSEINTRISSNVQLRSRPIVIVCSDTHGEIQKMALSNIMLHDSRQYWAMIITERCAVSSCCQGLALDYKLTPDATQWAMGLRWEDKGRRQCGHVPHQRRQERREAARGREGMT